MDTPGEARDVVVYDEIAFVADGAPGLQIIDVSAPALPSIVGSVDTAGNVRAVDVSGTLAAVIDGGAVSIVDVTNPTNPQIVGSIGIPGQAKDLVVRDTLAYVASFTGGLQIVDFTTPDNPQIIGGIPGSEISFP